DILPHPLYTLVAALERFSSAADAITLAWVNAGPRDLQAILRSGELLGRLSVSLRARPVASSLTLTGTRGSLTCDFIRSIVVGAANPGTEALEKVLNPMVEGAQLLSRTAFSVGRRILSGTSYPGPACAGVGRRGPQQRRSNRRGRGRRGRRARGGGNERRLRSASAQHDRRDPTSPARDARRTGFPSRPCEQSLGPQAAAHAVGAP